jgi:hypothetical protein
VKLSYGDAVALGDFFTSFVEIRRLASTPGKGVGTRGELLYILWHKIWKHDAEGKDGKLDVWYDRWAMHNADVRENKVTGSNISHFPNPLAGDLARSTAEKAMRRDASNMPVGAIATYRVAHEDALELAITAGHAKRPMDDALLADGFAGHFLTDAFSASHTRTARLSIKQYWDAKVPGFGKKLERWLVDKIADYHWGAVPRTAAWLGPLIPGATLLGHIPGLRSIPAVGQRLRDLTQAYGPITEMTRDKIGILLAGGDWNFGNVVSLLVHDYEGSRGVEAEVGGKPITLVGDKDLVDEKTRKPTAQGASTYQAAVEALRASIDDVNRAYTQAHHSDLTNLASVRQLLTSPYGLYKAERLVPTPIEDSRLPPGKRSLFWMHPDVNALLNDPDVQPALTAWAHSASSEFAKKLADMTDLPPQARAALQEALIDPLLRGDPKEIAGIIRSIISH